MRYLCTEYNSVYFVNFFFETKFLTPIKLITFTIVYMKDNNNKTMKKLHQNKNNNNDHFWREIVNNNKLQKILNYKLGYVDVIKGLRATAAIKRLAKVEQRILFYSLKVHKIPLDLQHLLFHWKLHSINSNCYWLHIIIIIYK